MPKLIAQWNPARDVWEEPTMGLFCEHSDVYSATWPSSGMTRDGTAYELPTSAHLTAASASSSLLPTPVASEANGAGSHGTGGLDLRTTVSLMPTPRATDGTKGGPNQRGSSGDLMLPSAVMLLPTPAVNDMGEGKTVEHWDEWTATMQAKHGNGNGHGKSLAIEAQRLLPTPTTQPTTGNGHARNLGSEILLLPTPSVADGMGGHLTRSGARSNELLLPGVAKSIGASTPPPSPDGRQSLDDPRPHLPSPDPRADTD